MITDYFAPKNIKPIITDYYELHKSFINRHHFSKVYDEIKDKIEINSSRKSCVCIDDKYKSNFTLYDLPLLVWTDTINEIKNNILTKYDKYEINYGLVHYYHDDKSIINWHSDKEALKSNIYSISIGGVRRFCLKDKHTKEVLEFDLYDGDLFIMKIGCQDKYEHCIKSVKIFNEPRISITFRQLEKPLCYYTLYPSELKVLVTENKPEEINYCKIFETKENIVIGIIQTENDNELFDLLVECTKCHASLIKSNLQKAIRRQLTDVALQSVMELIISGNQLDLLRRLTIISVEDVTINKYYSIIVWYYLALSHNYKLTKQDITIIFSYVKYLCEIDIFCEIKNDNKLYYLDSFYKNVDCLSLYLRLQFGGFNGEKIMLNQLITGIMNEDIDIYKKDMLLVDYRLYDKLTILECSIDFHCFPKMIEKVLAKINSKSESNLNESDIKNYMWHFDSSVNSRIKQQEILKLDKKTWNEIVKPACDNYRRYILKMIDI